MNTIRPHDAFLSLDLSLSLSLERLLDTPTPICLLRLCGSCLGVVLLVELLHRLGTEHFLIVIELQPLLMLGQCVGPRHYPRKDAELEGAPLQVAMAHIRLVVCLHKYVQSRLRVSKPKRCNRNHITLIRETNVAEVSLAFESLQEEKEKQEKREYESNESRV